MNILQSFDGYSQSLILIISEVALAILIFVLAGIIVRLSFGRLASIPFLQKYLGRSESVRKRISGC